MATLIKVWEITDKGLAEILDSVFADVHKESELEDWIAKDPKILGEDMIVLDRQREIAGVGRLDLLLMDASGRLVIVELKRDVSPREAVAQALDYASWLDGAMEDEVRANAGEYLGKDLDEVFEEHFHTEPPDWVCQNHRILIVAARLDASAERIINYLSERHHVEINAIFFTYAKLSGGKEVLVRSVLVPEAPGGDGKHRKPTEMSLMAMASDLGTATLIEICREMRSAWREVPENTAGVLFAIGVITREKERKWCSA